VNEINFKHEATPTTQEPANGHMHGDIEVSNRREKGGVEVVDDGWVNGWCTNYIWNMVVTARWQRVYFLKIKMPSL